MVKINPWMIAGRGRYAAGRVGKPSAIDARERNTNVLYTSYRRMDVQNRVRPSSQRLDLGVFTMVEWNRPAKMDSNHEARR